MYPKILNFQLSQDRGPGFIARKNDKSQDKTRDMIPADSAREAGRLYKASFNHFRKNRHFEALKDIQEAIRINPNFEKAQLLQAKIYLKMDDKTSAANCYEKYLELKPNDRDVLDFLILYYTERKHYSAAGETLERRAEFEKKKDIVKRMLNLAGRMYFIGEDYENARRVYHDLLKDDAYNTEIFRKLKTIYHRQGNRRKWKACREVLQLNRMITKNVNTDTTAIFKVDHPLTPELYESLVHPGEKNFRNYFNWIQPLFKMMEQSTPPEILRSSEIAAEGKILSLFMECCMFLNMTPPPLRCYRGRANFRFLADPIEHSDKYTFIYNEEFVNGLDDSELTFLFLNQLTLIKGNFIALLNLSLSDVAKVLLEALSLVFGVLTVLKSTPVNKASRIVGRFIHSKKFLDRVMAFHQKISRFRLAGRSPEEMQGLIRTSIEKMPDRIREGGEIDTANPMNRKFLENALMSFYNTADRTAYYFTRDHLSATRALVKLLETDDVFERIKRFGLQTYTKETRDNFLKGRLGELYFFSIDSDVFEKQMDSSAAPGENRDTRDSGILSEVKDELGK
jgi:tetratricopeptide (TPR) repeat protein